MMDVNTHWCPHLARRQGADLHRLLSTTDMAAEVTNWVKYLINERYLPMHTNTNNDVTECDVLTPPPPPPPHTHTHHACITFASHSLPHLTLHERSTMVTFCRNLKWSYNHFMRSSSTSLSKQINDLLKTYHSVPQSQALRVSMTYNTMWGWLRDLNLVLLWSNDWRPWFCSSNYKSQEWKYSKTSIKGHLRNAETSLNRTPLLCPTWSPSHWHVYSWIIWNKDTSINKTASCGPSVLIMEVSR